MNHAAILALLSSLYEQLAAAQAENKELRQMLQQTPPTEDEGE